MNIVERSVLLLVTVICFYCVSPQSSNTSWNAQVATEKMQMYWSDTLDQILKSIAPPTFLNEEYNIKDEVVFEASNIHPAVISSIKKCHQNGGGKVIIPPGKWFSDGPIHLLSNVHLFLTEGAEIVFSNEAAKYLPAVKVRWEGTVCWNYSPLIYAFEQENIAITGSGVINANGEKWSASWRSKQKPDQKRLRQMGNDLIPEDQRVFANGFLDRNNDGVDDGFGDGRNHYLRPTCMEFYGCQNILLQDFTVRNSPFWNIHPVFSKNVIIKNLDIFGGYLNDDGIDPDGCEEVLIDRCSIYTHDDAIAIKAGRDQDAWSRSGCRNVIVRNCLLASGVNAFTIGSEMSGGVANVFVENCRIAKGKSGLTFKTNLDRGGTVEDILFRNIQVDSVQESLFRFRMDYHGYRGNNYPTSFYNFYASNIHCNYAGQTALRIIGLSQNPIKNIFLNNVIIKQARQPYELKYVDHLSAMNSVINGQLLISEELDEAIVR